ncbi:hypothetical protein KQY30_07755 [Streptomyces sp. GMY02]|uniref:hypothetical protein n=1 Tax=Streptomyces sp. GMY02 TaxID=1333528 RepID=UPI001C2BE004|nr:hypothetical protein [Streptomyces sp. GMY02]QXE34197.1 hypothetical protein KQY30_07755 [Streptomyces sp. GMY02]
MIHFKFSLRPDQGDPSGFDLGDVVVTGEGGMSTSAGQSPDQGMMIYLSVSLLLDQMANLVTSSSGSFEFVGADSSFALAFRMRGSVVETSGRDGVVGAADSSEFVEELLRAAEEFAASELGGLPESDAVREDFSTSLLQFRRGLTR